VWATSAAGAVQAAVRSAAFSSAVAGLGGYDTADTGREEWVGG